MRELGNYCGRGRKERNEALTWNHPLGHVFLINRAENMAVGTNDSQAAAIQAPTEKSCDYLSCLKFLVVAASKP